MKGIFVSIIALFIVMFLVGCEGMDPFSSISDGMGDAIESIGEFGVKIFLPDFANQAPNGKMAPAANPRVYITGNLSPDVGLDSEQTTEITSGVATIRVRTVNTVWFRVWRDPGGTVYNVRMKGPADNDYVTFSKVDANGAYLVEFTPDGHVLPVEPQKGDYVQKITFKLRTKEKADKAIQLASDATSWAAVNMSFDSSTRNAETKEWTYTTYYKTGPLQAVLFSDSMRNYTYTLYINGTEAVYLIKKGTAWHFSGEIKSNGTFVNSGADNRSITITFDG